MHEHEGTVKGHGGIQLVWRATQPAGAARAAVLLVHGWGEHSGRYAALPAQFVPRGYAFWSYDLRGHGRSSGQRGHVAAWTVFHEDLRHVVALVHAAAPGVPLVLYGHSMGGLIALEYASRHPGDLAGVVVSAPGLRLDIPPPVFWLVRILSRHWPTFSGGRAHDPTDPLKHGRASVRLITEEKAAMARMMAAPVVGVPLLILHGTADALVPVEASRLFSARVRCADKTLREQAEGGHFPHTAPRADAFLAEVTDWLCARWRTLETTSGGGMPPSG